MAIEADQRVKVTALPNDCILYIPHQCHLCQLRQDHFLEQKKQEKDKQEKRSAEQMTSVSFSFLKEFAEGKSYALKLAQHKTIEFTRVL